MIYVVRHGQTLWNKVNMLMGKCDVELSDYGINQTIELSEKLKSIDFDLVITSPLHRALDSAKIICREKHINYIVDERLEERDFGELMGHNPTSFNYKSYWDYNLNKNLIYGEDIKTFFSRIYNVLDDIVDEYKNRNILLVLHYGVSIPVACYFANSIPEGSLIDYRIGLKNCEVKAYGPSIKNKIKRHF